MATAQRLEREEYIEQAYFFRAFRERLAENLSAQEILTRVHEEILTITRLPMAIQFLATEMKHAGLLGPALARLGHYFTPFQAFLISQAEDERMRFTLPIALNVLEREAKYKAEQPTPAGLFVYHLETISRNRLGYDEGIQAIGGDPLFDDDWREYLDLVRRQIGTIDFADLVYFRSEFFVQERRRMDPAFEPREVPLFAEKEGKIAKASRGRDPLFLFSALQRQLAYPEVPRPATRDDTAVKLSQFELKIRELENRVKLLEGEMRENVDLSQFGKPDVLKDPPNWKQFDDE
ncbi:hypothetical protein [Tuwongella immobilis]|uniref:Uncharacterized protein n=1 Tax=Tuwongella immobilis TaxID=692036 RepID=A0A6C2YPH4_9BACT|nr:hypothetical protein [Tuwongella immobilis]VIP03528.1 Uncharacterized protein OS=Singulisphaera acidiphila (strain ATCC BAA-1392 / DSM 18658 / VKM B-2454 / MOB10) GN=Sinac_3289 PE=4 SV=1 [Tuwongella immobilis]VTS04424.1 Uncharacterized protein OS=Singulisphaera acidiphila (strain ATCC BAA-1392 / DSM 18658 / VKM B-2454 / MOB10) GN=Sinac_3289 PE=4 SV=1 [Tuwongella immobilis]